jgi:TPR repeat protein
MKDNIEPQPRGHHTAEAELLANAYKELFHNPVSAVQTLTSLADSGSAWSMLYLGYAFRSGTGVNIDVSKAVSWYRRAMDLGLLRAGYHLGRLYLDNQQYTDARITFERSAMDGFAPSTHFLGRIYFFGFGVPIDKARGRALLESASKAGCIFAKALLAHDLVHEGGSVRAQIKGVFMKTSCYIDLAIVLLTERMSSDRLC